MARATASTMFAYENVTEPPGFTTKAVLSVGRILEPYHNLVRMDDIQLAAQQLADHVGIGAFGVEQFDLVAQHIALGRQFGQLRLSLVAKPQVFAPCEQAGRACDREPTHEQQSEQGEGLYPALASLAQNCAFAFHIATESLLPPARKPPCALKDLRNLHEHRSVASLTRSARVGN